MAKFIKVAKTIDLAPRQKTLVDYQSTPVDLFNIDGEFCAIEDVCTHHGDAPVEGELHRCPSLGLPPGQAAISAISLARASAPGCRQDGQRWEHAFFSRVMG